MSAHTRWETIKSNAELVATSNPERQLAFIRGYALALEDLIKDFTARYGSPPGVITLDGVIDHLDELLLEVLQTMALVLEKTPMQEVPDETSG